MAKRRIARPPAVNPDETWRELADTLRRMAHTEIVGALKHAEVALRDAAAQQARGRESA